MVQNVDFVRRFTLLTMLLLVGDMHAAVKIRVSGGGMTPLDSIIWVANQEGLFKKYGMDVEYLVMNSGTLGVQTLESLRVMEPSILDELRESGFIDKVRK